MTVLIALFERPTKQSSHNRAIVFCLCSTCPVNYTRTSSLSCASNSDSCFKETCKKERPFWRSFDSYIIPGQVFVNKFDFKTWQTNESSFTVIHQHVQNRANKRLNFQIYSSKFHSADPLCKHRTHATTFVLRKKNAANKTTMSTAQQRRYQEHGLVLPNAGNKGKVSHYQR